MSNGRHYRRGVRRGQLERAYLAAFDQPAEFVRDLSAGFEVWKRGEVAFVVAGVPEDAPPPVRAAFDPTPPGQPRRAVRLWWAPSPAPDGWRRHHSTNSARDRLHGRRLELGRACPGRGVSVAGVTGVTMTAQHLQVMLERHRRWCRDNGIGLPVDVVDLVRIVTVCQGVTDDGSGLALSHDAGVTMAFDFDEAGRLLGVSGRTVRRLVDGGHLQAVSVGTRRRIPRTELVAYLERQLAETPGGGPPGGVDLGPRGPGARCL